MELSKIVAYDDRVVQHKPRYTLFKGGSAISSSVNVATSANTSQHLFTVLPPSMNCFVDRKLSWSCDVFLAVTVAAIPARVAGVDTGLASVGTPILKDAMDVALCAFPLHEMANNISCQINTQQVSFSCNDMKNEILRLATLKKNMQQRQCPSLLDNVVTYDSLNGCMNNVMNGFGDTVPGGITPNGAYDIQFTDINGAVLPGGCPVFVAANADPAINNLNAWNFPTTVYIKFKSTENLLLSPFIFNDVHENEVGLYGVQTMKFTIGIGGAGRVLRNNTLSRGRTITNVAFNNAALGTGGAFQNSAIHAIYITPPLGLKLPEQSVVPHNTYSRYGKSTGAMLANAKGVFLDSQSIQLTGVPDMLIVYARPTTYTNIAGAPYSEADWHLAINSLNINFDNHNGLMSTFNKQQLFNISLNNGLDEISYPEWSGYATRKDGGVIPTVGSLVCIRPGIDFELPPSLCSGVSGKFQCSIKLNVDNQSALPLADVTIDIIAVSSGYLVCSNGSSAVIENPISMDDAINPDTYAHTTQASLHRYVGGNILNKFANVVSKGIHGYKLAKPILNRIKSAYQEVVEGKKPKRRMPRRLA